MYSMVPRSLILLHFDIDRAVVLSVNEKKRREFRIFKAEPFPYIYKKVGEERYT